MKISDKFLMSFNSLLGDAGRNSSSSSSSPNPPRKRIRLSKSVVHDHFPRQELTEAETLSGIKVKVQCKYCSKIYHHANSEDLKTHLRKEHNQAFLEVEKEDENAREGREKRLMASQTPTNQKVEISRSFYKFLFTSGIPVSAIAENEEFHEFCQRMNAGFGIPSRRTIARKGEVLSYQQKNQLRKELENSDMIHLTTDHWTSSGMTDSYLGVTAHYFDHEKQELKYFRLACRHMKVDAKGENIADLLTSITDEYGITSKVMFIVADNASVMSKAVRLYNSNQENQHPHWNSNGELDVELDEDLEEDVEEFLHEEEEEEERLHIEVCTRINVSRLGCFEHLINLAVKKTIKQGYFYPLLYKVKALVAKFAKSEKAKRLLYEKVPLRLVKYCQVRWWTEFLMLERLYKICMEGGIQSVNSVIHKMEIWPLHLQLTEGDVKEMKDFLDIFQEIMEKANIFSAEKTATIHLVIPTVAEINGHIDELLIFHEETRDLEEFLQTLKININQYFAFLDSEDKNVYVVATYLSPIHSQVLNENQVKTAEKILVELLLSSGGWNSTHPTQQQVRETVEIPGFKHLSVHIRRQRESETRNPQEEHLSEFRKSRDDEIKLFMRGGDLLDGIPSSKNLCPIKFFLKNPQLKVSKTALNILSIPPSSTPSERLFSMAGYLCSARRASMLPESLERNVMLKVNWPLLGAGFDMNSLFL